MVSALQPRGQLPGGIFALRAGQLRCSTCRRVRPQQDFGIERRRTTGRTARCRDCRKPVEDRFRGSHPGRSRRWAIENAEKVRESSRKSYLRRRDAGVIRRAPETPDQRRDKLARYKARKRNAPVVENVKRQVVFERDEGVCGICGEPVDPRNFHVDHVVALANGGEHSYRNVQVAHPRCNQSKGDR